jgi:hypothetical protein
VKVAGSSEVNRFRSSHLRWYVGIAPVGITEPIQPNRMGGVTAMETMENKRFLLCTAGIFLITVAAGWIHGGGEPRYANWTAVAEKVDCRMVARFGRDVNVAGPLVVDDKTFFEHIITDETTIKLIDDRCHLKGG